MDTALGNLAKRPPLEEGTESFDTTMERGALSHSRSHPFPLEAVAGNCGGEPVMEDAVSQMANIQKTLDDEIAQQNEIFKPIFAKRNRRTETNRAWYAAIGRHR